VSASDLHSCAFFAPFDRVLCEGKKKERARQRERGEGREEELKAFLHAVLKAILEKYTDGISVCLSVCLSVSLSLSFFFVINNIAECLTFWATFYVYLFMFSCRTRAQILSGSRIITNIIGTNSIFRDRLFSTHMMLRCLMCIRRGRAVAVAIAAEYIDTSRLSRAYA